MLKSLDRMAEKTIPDRGWRSRLLDAVAGFSSEKILTLLGFAILMLTIMIFLAEHGNGSGFDNIERSLYWMVVTMTTTGYGDITPKTPLGRTLTVFMIVSSLFFVSIITATIASKLVERKLLEGKGMNEVRLKGHLIICGYNHMANSLLDAIYRQLLRRAAGISETISRAPSTAGARRWPLRAAWRKRLWITREPLTFGRLSWRKRAAWS